MIVMTVMKLKIFGVATTIQVQSESRFSTVKCPMKHAIVDQRASILMNVWLILTTARCTQSAKTMLHTLDVAKNMYGIEGGNANALLDIFSSMAQRETVTIV